MEHFWDHNETVQDGMGYGQFTPAHLILVAISIVFIAAVVLAYKRSDEKRKILIRRIIGIGIIVIEVFKYSSYPIIGVNLSEYLPLEICSFAGYSILIDCLLVNSHFFSDLLMLMFLPGAIMPLIFPTTTILPAINYYTFHQFLFHSLIIAYVLMRFFCGELKPTYKGLWKSVPKILVLAGVIYIIDVVFDRNFMFLRRTFGNFLLNIIEGITGPGVPYTLGLLVLVMIVLHIFFVIFKILEKLFVKNGDAKGLIER